MDFYRKRRKRRKIFQSSTANRFTNCDYYNLTSIIIIDKRDVPHVSKQPPTNNR
jgi:hypothetical protein